MKDPKLKNEYRKNIRNEAHKVFNDAMSFADEFEKEIKKEKINNILNDKYIYLYLSFFIPFSTQI